VQGPKIVRPDPILIARQNQGRRSPLTRDAGCVAERCGHPFLPFLVHTHFDRQVRDDSSKLIRMMSENNQHSPDVSV